MQEVLALLLAKYFGVSSDYQKCGRAVRAACLGHAPVSPKGSAV